MCYISKIGLLIYITYGIKHSKERKTIAICDTDPLIIPNESKNTPKPSTSSFETDQNEEDDDEDEEEDDSIKLMPSEAVYVNASTPDVISPKRPLLAETET